MNGGAVAGSFRDPSGFVFTQRGVLFRQVNQSCAANYRLLMESGLYESLVEAGSTLILEFVPKADPKAQVLLASRENIFPNYRREGLEKAFAGLFQMERRTRIPDSQRTLYLFRK